MNGFDFAVQLDRLRQGKLELQAMGESGMTAYASTSLYELREYVKALEAGYRANTQRLTAYRAKASGKSIAELAENQWSEGACLGYAAMAFRQSGLSPDQAVGLLELMADLMEEYSLEQAAEAHQAIISGRGETPPPLRRSPSPASRGGKAVDEGTSDA